MAQRATSLGPKPSLFIIFWFVFGLFLFLSFLCFVIQKNLVFPLEKGIFGLFLSVSLCFSLAFCASPFFNFSFSVSLFFLSFFRSFLSFFFAFFCFLVFVSVFPFLSSLLLFHERTISEYSITKFSFINLFSILGFLSSFLFEIPFLIFFC